MISNKDELKTIISSKKQELAQIKRKEYLLANKEKISAPKKIRHQINSDDLKRRNKEYYEKNKKYVHDTFTSKVECTCGQIISLGYKRRHLKTKIHLLNLHDIAGCISSEQYKSFYQEVKNQNWCEIQNSVCG